MLEEGIYLNCLYDYYGELLTEKQKLYFEEYYFNNLTLAEISENYEVSRNAVHKNIKETTLKLLEYEEKLKLYEKACNLRKIIENLDKNIKEQIEEWI
ncbi:MAG: hypothetical protein HFH08_01760 [Bacilli bacterium]|jgi:predicted DNA-binding protein YlxM (UPF0122 family)|nr:hypothetical protein [Bacilli bacterium]